MPTSAYIHIPFCKSKCRYCSFVSFNRLDLIDIYINCLLKEIDNSYNKERLNTLYIGGGTPSLISADLLQKIINKFNITSDTEVTCEINPDDSSLEYLKALKNIGINRLSIGSQTFDDNILKIIGRRHNSKQITNTVITAKNAGFKNISVDLIYGLPNQNLNNIVYDIKKFLKLDIQHISTYGLKIENNSFFGKFPPENLPDEDTQADMYELINIMLEKKGYIRYEISNFAKNSYESKHNLNYWNNCEYYGFGISAHGYIKGIRYSNFNTLEEYLNKSTTHECDKLLTKQEKLEEEIFLGFRKTEGINTDIINRKYNIDFEKKYSKILEKYADFIEKTKLGFKLNLKGVLISNIILSDFLC